MNNAVKRSEKECTNVMCVNCSKVVDFTDDLEYVCKHGAVRCIMRSYPKCKYFKRNSKYITAKALAKKKASYKNNKKIRIEYIRGKFKRIIEG